jgi:hypothetical protein
MDTNFVLPAPFLFSLLPVYISRTRVFWTVTELGLFVLVDEVWNEKMVVQNWVAT